MASTRGRKQPMDFRKDEVSYVMQRWKASDSCSLVGVGSVGKSNLLQHLANPEVQKAYMNITNSGDFKVIIIDPNLLGPLPSTGQDVEQIRCWAGYELLMHRLFMAFYPFEEGAISREDGMRFYEAYQGLQDGTNPLYAYMGLRYFELGLEILMRHGIRIVFMFDEFEEMLKHLPAKFFQTLRGIRDANKRQLSYLTFTRAPLSALVNQFELSILDLEPFTELFTDSIYYVSPYNKVDAKRMVDNLMARNDKKLNNQEIEFLMWSTGRYAGLLRSGLRLMDSLGEIDSSSMLNDELVRKLAIRRPIRMECKTIWMSLTQPEHHVLRAVAGLETYNSNTETENAVAMLVQKHLLSVDKMNQTLHIQPPVFRAFVGSNPETS